MSDWKGFERQVGGVFSRWISSPWVKGGRNDLICRQALYGRMIERKYGDLAIHPDCPEKWKAPARWFMDTAMVDAKARASFRIASLLTNPNHAFYKWWAKLTHDAAMAGAKKRFMVMLTKPGNEHIVVFGNREKEWLKSMAGDRWLFPMMTLRRWVLPALEAEAAEEEILTLCEFETLFGHVDAHLMGCPAPVVEATRDSTPPTA